MESKAKLFGHPIHPMLVVFPLAMFVTAVIFDIIYLTTGTEVLATVAFYMILVGLVGGVAAAVFGLRDFYGIPRETRAKRMGFLHGLGNVVVILFFSLSLLIRYNAAESEPPTLALLASFAGGGLALITAWMGGELVYRLGVGVDEGANVNAPNSMGTESTEPLTMERVPITGKKKVLNDPEAPSEDELDE